jgi:hypothetical protein
MEEETDLLSVAEELARVLSFACESKEDTIKVWLLLGRAMGIENFFPHIKVSAVEDKRGDHQPIILVGSASAELSEYLSSNQIITEKIAKICLEELEALMEKKSH